MANNIQCKHYKLAELPQKKSVSFSIALIFLTYFRTCHQLHVERNPEIAFVHLNNTMADALCMLCMWCLFSFREEYKLNDGENEIETN